MFANFTDKSTGTITELWIDNRRDAYIRICECDREVAFFKVGTSVHGPTELIVYADIPTSALRHVMECLALLRSLANRRYDPYANICDMPPEYVPMGQQKADRLAHLDVLMNQFASPTRRKTRKRDAKGRYISTR